MKTNKIDFLQSLVKRFEENILFSDKNKKQDIVGVFIDRKSKENRIVIITKEDSDENAVKALVKSHFDSTFYTIIKRTGLPESTSTLNTGKGIKHFKSTEWGTLGGVFKRRNDNHSYGLSNAHVIAGVQNPSRGDTCIYQPNIKAGKLYQWYKLKPPPVINKMDAALFQINPNHNGKWQPIKPKKWIGPRINLRVYKNGMATDITHGTIRSYNGSARVKLNGNLYFFSGIMAIKSSTGHFNKGGDSGSIVFSEAGNHMVGLVFAKYHEYCWALPISRIKPLLQN